MLVINVEMYPKACFQPRRYTCKDIKHNHQTLSLSVNWLVWLDPPVVFGDGQNLGQHVQHSLSIPKTPNKRKSLYKSRPVEWKGEVGDIDGMQWLASY